MITSAKDMDLKEILNLMYWCDHFIWLVPQPFIKYFRDIRNRKWGRVTKLELNNYAMLKKPMPLGMEALLQDLENTLHEIQILKTVTDANNFHAKILTQYKEMIK